MKEEKKSNKKRNKIIDETVSLHFWIEKNTLNTGKDYWQHFEGKGRRGKYGIFVAG